jgi:hypothetical protein
MRDIVDRLIALERRFDLRVFVVSSVVIPPPSLYDFVIVRMCTIGFLMSVQREMLGVGVFFTAYEAVSRSLHPVDSIPAPLRTIIAGSAAGIAYWTAGIAPLPLSISLARFVF